MTTDETVAHYINEAKKAQIEAEKQDMIHAQELAKEATEARKAEYNREGRKRNGGS